MRCASQGHILSSQSIHLLLTDLVASGARHLDSAGSIDWLTSLSKDEQEQRKVLLLRKPPNLNPILRLSIAAVYKSAPAGLLGEVCPPSQHFGNHCRAFSRVAFDSVNYFGMGVESRARNIWGNVEPAFYHLRRQH